MGQNSIPNGYFYLPDLGAKGQAEMDTYNARMNATDEIIGNMWVNGQWNPNSITIGDGTAGNKVILAYNEDANLPGLRYNDTANQWEFSNDGVVWTAIAGTPVSTITGTTADSFEINTDGFGLIIDTTGMTQDRTVNGEDLYLAIQHAQTTHDYAYISGNDAATDVTGAELETLTDGSVADALHTHTGLAISHSLDDAYDDGNTITVDGSAVTLNSSILAAIIINSTSNGSHLRFTGDPTVAAPVDGDFWYDGTSLNFYDGATTHDLIAPVVVSLDSAYNGGNTIDVDGDPVTMTTSDGDNNRVLDVVQNDVTNDPDAMHITNSGGGTGLLIDMTGVLNGSQAGLKVYSNAAQVNAPLVWMDQDNASSSATLCYIRNDGTGNALQVQQVGSAGQAVYITMAGTGVGLRIDANGNGPHLNLYGDPTVASPVDGDFWYTGSQLNIRDGATTRDLLSLFAGTGLKVHGTDTFTNETGPKTISSLDATKLYRMVFFGSMNALAGKPSFLVNGGATNAEYGFSEQSAAAVAGFQGTGLECLNGNVAGNSMCMVDLLFGADANDRKKVQITGTCGGERDASNRISSRFWCKTLMAADLTSFSLQFSNNATGKMVIYEVGAN